MKNKKLLVFILSGLIPLLIFFIFATLNNYVPLGDEMLNIYDSYTQYPGFLLELKSLLLSGNLFYSFGAGLGFNFFGALCYYAISPLNLLSLLATPKNYPYFISYMTYLRIFLLGLSMCFYLVKRNTKNSYTVIFSTIFALMGFTSTYYYNYLWIDSIILLPLVIHGLDKLIDGNSPRFYIVALSIAIICNFYMGYMIAAFCLLYFIYRMIIKKDRKKEIKTFITSSLLAGLISCIVLVPAYFALKTGKASLYGAMDYSGISSNALTFFYTLTIGEYIWGDQSFGPAIVYTSVLSIVLSIMLFFNKNITKREKIVTLCMFAFFYLSFSVNALNYLWQMLQKPIWWNSRFSYIFSFFTIIVALRSLENIEFVKIKLSHRVLISIIFTLLVLIGLITRLNITYLQNPHIQNYIFLTFSILTFIEFVFLVDKRYMFSVIFAMSLIDVSINTFNSLKENKRNQYSNFYIGLRTDLPEVIKTLDEKNDGEFYRFELTEPFSSNDGMYFNYNGINYFSSSRNIKVINLLDNLGLQVSEKCSVVLDTFDPVLLSLLNIKYVRGNLGYFDSIGDGIYENRYPLALGFTSQEGIKNLTLKRDDERSEYGSSENIYAKENLNSIVESLLGEKLDLYERIDAKDFTLENLKIESNRIKYIDTTHDAFMKYTFTSDKEYLIMPAKEIVEITINGEKYEEKHSYAHVNVGDKVEISYNIYAELDENRIFLNLLDVNKYEYAMQKLSKNLLKVKKYTNGHLLDGEITLDEPEYLFTTIHYENGMKVYVDGKEIEPDIVLDTLIGFNLESGNHKIYIDYIPEGLNTGLTLSLSGIIISLFYLQKRKKSL